MTPMHTIRSALLREPHTLDELVGACGIRRRAVIKKLHRLKEQGDALRIDGTGRSGRYCHPVWAILS